MSLEPWPPLHKLPEFRMRLLRIVIVATVVVIITANFIGKVRG